MQPAIKVGCTSQQLFDTNAQRQHSAMQNSMRKKRTSSARKQTRYDVVERSAYSLWLTCLKISYGLTAPLLVGTTYAKKVMA